jgi:hypothetical protein
MDWVGYVHWTALFIAVLGPLLGFGTQSLALLMFLLGIVAAIGVYNKPLKADALIILLLIVLVFSSISISGYQPLVSYLFSVSYLGAWYVIPLALLEGWRELIA